MKPARAWNDAETEAMPPKPMRVPPLPVESLPGDMDRYSVVAENPWSLLSAIVDSCEDAIISKDLTGTITSWNKAATRMFGYAAKEMIGKSILRLIPEELRYEETDILRRISSGERIERFETRRASKSGEILDLSLTISPIRDPSGRIIGASKIAHDIRERRQAQETRSRLAAIVESSDDAILSKSLNGIVTSWNEAAQRMFGYTAEEMVGRSILTIIPRELHSEEAEILRKMRAGERIDHFETWRVTKAGARVEVSLSISPVRDGSGNIIGTSKIARDISGRKKMERRLLQSEKLAATGRMAATIAHEINNPLEAVINLVFLAQHSAPEGSETAGYLAIAEGEIERVSQLARTTLGYYRDRATPSKLLLHELADATLLVYASRISARNIRVEREYKDTCPVMVSRGEMLQVFSNVVSNAIDAMASGGRLRICTDDYAGPRTRIARVVIEDQGSGIEEENLSRIFEAFFTTKPDVGNGIGLWVSRQLVENYGGTIRISSNTVPPENGTRVAIELPAQKSDHSGGKSPDHS